MTDRHLLLGSGVWAKFLLRRLLGMLVVLSVLLVATFLMVRLVPGDPARALAGTRASPAYIKQLRASLGLNQAFATQFKDYVGGVLHFNLGTSFDTGEPVSTVIGERIVHTAQLAGVSVVAVMVLSITFGILSAAGTRDGRNRWLEILFTVVTSIGGSIPNYLAGTFLAFLFAVEWQWLPVAGADHWYSIILPAASLSILPTSYLTRIVRLEALNVLAQDYILTARSKRLPDWMIYARHVLPNVLTAALTIGGLYFAGLIGGAVIVENVFAWPGLGTALIHAVLAHDYPVIQGITLLLGAAVVIVNAFVDVVLGLIDPRSLIR